jgi:protein O-mannosyl-transferase
MSGKRLYLVVALCAVVVYLGALKNRFAFDDLPIVLWNSLFTKPGAWWRAFASSYWPPEMGGGMYRPLTIFTYALDWQVARMPWFHAVNVLWHAGVSVAVAAFARRWAGDKAALSAGLIFAVHPVHVEAVANIAGRAELMAALFAMVAVYAALARDQVWWSALGAALALLCKENGAVVPALIVWGWLVGLARPPGRRMALYAGSWIVVGVLYAVVRWYVLRPYVGVFNIAAQFVGASPFQIRLTAVAAFADFARLLVLPLHLRVDYSPAERTLVTSPLDGRFLLGVLCLAVWAGLLWVTWRRGRKVEAFGLGWIGVALLPVANLLYPAGVLVAERTLYLPSVGLALAAGAALGAWGDKATAGEGSPASRQLARTVVLSLLTLAGGVRTFLRTPVWRDELTVVLSEFEDSPRSFDGPSRMVGIYLSQHKPEKAFEAFSIAERIYNQLPWLYMAGADVAFNLRRSGLADSMLTRLEQLCSHCEFYYRFEAAAARARGDSTVADSLLGRLARLGQLP